MIIKDLLNNQYVSFKQVKIGLWLKRHRRSYSLSVTNIFINDFSITNFNLFQFFPFLEHLIWDSRDSSDQPSYITIQLKEWYDWKSMRNHLYYWK